MSESDKSKQLKKSEVNHLRKLLGWVRCDIGQSPEEYLQTTKAVLENFQHDTLSEEAKNRLVEGHVKSSNVPQYVRDAIKALEKTLKRYDGEIVDGEFESDDTVDSIIKCIESKTLLLVQSDKQRQLDKHLIMAVDDCSQQAVEKLLLEGANPNAQSCGEWSGIPALVIACRKSNPVIVGLLLQHGANPNFIDTNGWQAIHWAAMYGNAKCVDLLIKFGADVNALSTEDDTHIVSPLLNACDHAKHESILLLLENKADPNLNLDGNSPLHSLIHEYAQTGKAQKPAILDSVKILLEHGASLEVADKDGVTAFDCASEKAKEIFELFVEYRARNK